MRHFPVFLKVDGQRIVVSGAGETAVAKLRLLLKTSGRISVYGVNPDNQILAWAQTGKIKFVERPASHGDFLCAAMVYCANDDPQEDARVAAIAHHEARLVNIVDNLADSQFITPALVDRDPVTVAIGTEGAAPVLARKIKSDIESTLPASLGTLARIGQDFRPQAAQLPMGRVRRAFWQRFYYELGPADLKAGGEEAVRHGLEKLLRETLSTTGANDEPKPGKVGLIGCGPGDPDLLTLKAHKFLHEADVVIHDRLVSPEILELARREATVIEVGKTGFGPSWKQEDINQLMVEHAGEGSVIARLKSGDPAVFGRLDEEMDALDAAGIAFEIVPGITTASAAAANMQVSLTKRRRNSALQILTGHDVKGFADHDWRNLAKHGSVAAIYMGLKSASFLRGRLMMHGASGDTPVTVIENASRANQRTLATTLLHLPEALETEAIRGPAILMLGLAPRSAKNVVATLREIETNTAGANP